MPTYALLGATGATGSAILRCLLSQPPKDLTLNIFVRSRSKLLNAFPDLEGTAAFKINIIEGTPNDSAAMQRCLKDVDVVMGCIGTNVSTPGMTLIYDTISAVIDALRIHQKTQASAYRTATVIQLRSASVNPIFKAEAPWIATRMASFLFHYVYADLERASELLVSIKANSPGLLDYIFIDPPALHDADGTTPTGYKLLLKGKQEAALSYPDLGASFCEVARRRDEFSGKGIGPSATGAVTLTLGTTLGFVGAALKGRIWG